MKSNEWKNDAKCLDYDTDLFFDKYEENEGLRLSIDSLCLECPAIRQCFAVGVSQRVGSMGRYLSRVWYNI